jgi:hypothetical protein
MVTVTTKATSRCTRNKRIMNREREREGNLKEDKSRGVPLTCPLTVTAAIKIINPVQNSHGLH